MSAELCYYNARYYDPELGRFVQADTEADLANPQDLNPYTYVNNNPLNLTDPTGHAVANYGTEQALTRNKQLPLKQDLANYIDGFQVVWSADPTKGTNHPAAFGMGLRSSSRASRKVPSEVLSSGL